LDPDFEENEKKYGAIKKEILGVEYDGGEGDDTEEARGEEDGSEEDSDEEEREARMQIQDETETNLVNLRRTIYLTIMSSVDFEEAGHKLLEIKLEPRQEVFSPLDLLLNLSGIVYGGCALLLFDQIWTFCCLRRY
jgi:pre-mRNA-splicing factor CWC22